MRGSDVALVGRSEPESESSPGLRRHLRQDGEGANVPIGKLYTVVAKLTSLSDLLEIFNAEKNCLQQQFLT